MAYTPALGVKPRTITKAGLGKAAPQVQRTAGLGGRGPSINRVAGGAKPAPKPPKILQPKQGGTAPPMPAPEPPSQSAASAASTANAWMGDPQRLAELNQIQLDQTTGIADIQGAASRDERNTQGSRELLAKTLAGNRVGALRSANKLGLARSGYQDRKQGDLTTTYGRDLTNLEQAFGERAAGRSEQLAGLKSKAAWAMQESDTGAVGRQIDRDQSFGVPLPGPTPAEQVAATLVKAKPPPFKRIAHTDSTGRKGYIHVRPDGARIFVPARK